MNELTNEFASAVEADSLIQLVLSRPVQPETPTGSGAPGSATNQPDQLGVSHGAGEHSSGEHSSGDHVLGDHVFGDHGADDRGADNQNSTVPTTPPPVVPTARKVVIRPVDLKSGRMLQFTFSDGQQETHRNFPANSGIAEVERLTGSRFRHGHLFTTEADVTARFRASGKVRVHRHPPSKQRPESLRHNRAKNHVIPEGVPCPFLAEIGVMNDEGQVRKKKYDKFRQINRYLEFVEDIYAELPARGPVRIVDFGCGKSYLTFALHHLLAVVHERRVQITGLDLKRDVVDHCNEIAARLGCHGLTFEAGDMSSYEPPGPVDLSVSLHACDTATDMALARAIGWNAKVIFAVPCCHHEVASMLDGEFLSIVQRHGILRERLADLLTDSMRAELLNASGYRTGVSEFISLEHTPKNVLIRAIRERSREAEASGFAGSPAVEDLRNRFGLLPCTLERLLSSEQGASV